MNGLFLYRQLLHRDGYKNNDSQKITSQLTIMLTTRMGAYSAAR